MGLLQILNSPSAIKLAMAASGVECARVDYDQRTDEVVLSIVVADRVHHYRLPCKCTFTREEIAAWLTGETYLDEKSSEQKGSTQPSISG